jgi:predicted ester cyclase
MRHRPKVARSRANHEAAIQPSTPTSPPFHRVRVQDLSMVLLGDASRGGPPSITPRIVSLRDRYPKGVIGGNRCPGKESVMPIRSLAASSLVASLIILGGCISPQLTPEGTNAALVGRLLEDLQAGSFEWFDELCAPRYRFHAAGSPEPVGCAAQKNAIRQFRRSFTNLDLTIEEVFGGADKVAFRLTQSGTHTGEFLGIPPTGRPVRFRVLGVARIANGKMIEMWLDLDWPTLFDQIGTTPPAWHRRWVDRIEPLPPLDGESPGGP